jgi:hypothetical protein
VKQGHVEEEPAGAVEWVAGGGEMGALIRAKDWNDTPIG